MLGFQPIAAEGWPKHVEDSSRHLLIFIDLKTDMLLRVLLLRAAARRGGRGPAALVLQEAPDLRLHALGLRTTSAKGRSRPGIVGCKKKNPVEVYKMKLFQYIFSRSNNIPAKNRLFSRKCNHQFIDSDRIGVKKLEVTKKLARDELAGLPVE